MTALSAMALALFLLATVVELVMIARITSLLTPSKHRAEEDRLGNAVRMSAVTGIWEISVAVVLWSMHDLSDALGPGLLGAMLVASYWVAPAIRRRATAGFNSDGRTGKLT